MRKFRVSAGLLLSLAVGRCASPPVPRIDVESEKAALIRTDAEFSAAAEARGIAQAFSSYAASDAIILPMNADPVAGPDAIRAHFAETPVEATLTWKPTKADVSRSGDLGYTLGTYEYRAPGPDGKLVTRYGKYCSIWKKQPDGAWKFVVDLGNSSPPPK